MRVVTVEFTIQGCVPTKHRHRRGTNRKTGQSFSHDDPRNAPMQERIAWLFQAAAGGRWPHGWLGPVSMTIFAFQPAAPSWAKWRQACAFWDVRKPDVDTLKKIIADALEGIAYRNDSQIAELLVRKRVARCGPRVEVKLATLETAQDRRALLAPKKKPTRTRRVKRKRKGKQ